MLRRGGSYEGLSECPGRRTAQVGTCLFSSLIYTFSLRVALHIHIDIIVEVLRFLPRSELETAQLASRRWSNVIGRVEGSLQQRRSIFVIIIKVLSVSNVAAVLM